MAHTATIHDIDGALRHLRAALAILDDRGDHVAAANLDHVIRIVEDRLPEDRPVPPRP